jgi:UTP:GlnB (protein PII) uridylyltransferase
MKYGLTQAAQATGKSRSSIYRAIKSGVISAHRRDDGQFEIDPAELHRVFPAISRNVSQAVPEQANETAVEVLKREVELLREALERERSHSREFADLLREEREERRRLTALLVHQSQQSEQAREAQHQGQEPGHRTLLEKLFGRRGT